MENLSYIGCFLSGITSVIIVTYGIYQVYGLRKSIEQSNLMAIFEVEFELNRRKARMADIRVKTQELLVSFDLNNLSQENRDFIEIRDGLFKEALEDYLNVFDRLCYFINQGIFNEKDFKLEYRDMLFETIKAYDEKFKIGTQYRNMLKLYDKWKES